MNKKVFCDCCQKKEIEAGQEGVYLGEYRGDKNSDKIHICYDCYNSKEKWYLENYAHIYSYSSKQHKEKGTGYVKGDSKPCYDKKNQMVKYWNRILVLIARLEKINRMITFLIIKSSNIFNLTTLNLLL